MKEIRIWRENLISYAKIHEIYMHVYHIYMLLLKKEWYFQVSKKDDMGLFPYDNSACNYGDDELQGHVGPAVQLQFTRARQNGD